MSIYTTTDYREALRQIVAERKQFEKRFGFYTLADAARIQRPYLSKVMKGTAQLSPDQMFLITDFLQFDTEQQEYMQLLLELDRTAVTKRREGLEKQINHIAERHRDSAAHLKARVVDQTEESFGANLSDYYLDPLIQIVHVAISIKAFQEQPLKLAEALRLPGRQLYDILANLERMGLATQQRGAYKPLEPQMHLAKSSPLYRAWRNQQKLLSIQKINQLGEQAYSFSTVFSGDLKTRTKIHERFLAFLAECEDLVERAPARQVMQLSFDLFPWTGNEQSY